MAEAAKVFCAFLPGGVILTVAHGDVACPRCGERFADHPGVLVEVSPSVAPNLAYVLPADARRG